MWGMGTGGKVPESVDVKKPQTVEEIGHSEDEESTEADSDTKEPSTVNLSPQGI